MMSRMILRAGARLAEPAPSRREALVACGVLAALGVMWFLTLPPGILMGDDLRLVYGAQHGGYAGSPLGFFAQSEFDKYRPVLTFLLSLLIPVFGHNFWAYQAVNLAVEIADSALVVLIAWRMSRGSRLLSMSAGIAFLLSRFGYYAVMQLYGLMEGLALGFTLLVVHEALRAYETQRLARLGRAVTWFGLAVFTDERYVAVLVFVLACIVLHPEVSAARRRALGLTVVAVSIVVLYFLVKTVALHTRLLVGTAGADLTFDPHALETFYLTGLMNVIGFNLGPDYLAGRNVAEVPLGYLFGTVFAIGAALVAVAYVRFGRRGESAGWWRPALLAAALFLPLLLTASVTIRQEFRWLYAPFAVFLLALVAAAGALRERRTDAIVAVMLATSVLSALFYRSFVDNVYFFYAMKMAHTVHDVLALDPPETVVIQTHGDTALENWVFMRSAFFEEYGLNDTVRYVDALPAGGDATLASSSHVRLFDDRGGTSIVAVEVPAASRARTEGRQVLRLSLTDQFGRGTINSHAHVSTPSGEGAFVMDWPSASGSVHSLTVLAGFRYTYLGIPIRSGDALVFSAVDPYSVGGGTRGFVEVRAGRDDAEIFRSDFKPSPQTDRPAWQEFRVPLDRFAGKSVSMTFGADALTGDQTAAWLAFGTPKIVAAPPRSAR